MGKFVLGILIGAIVFAAYQGNDDAANKAKSGRVFEDARTDDGRIDLSIVVDSNKFTEERINAFKQADADSDGYLTKEECDNILKATEEGRLARANIVDTNAQPDVSPCSDLIPNPTGQFSQQTVYDEETIECIDEVDDYIAQFDSKWHDDDTCLEISHQNCPSQNSWSSQEQRVENALWNREPEWYNSPIFMSSVNETNHVESQKQTNSQHQIDSNSPCLQQRVISS